MCDTRKAMTLTVENQTDNRGNNDEVDEIKDSQGKKEKSENRYLVYIGNNNNMMMTTMMMITIITYMCRFRQKSQRKSLVPYSISLIVLHVLDALLLMILLPFMIWQWISANDRLKIILKAVVEVTLELIMWVIFAGVSILMTTTFVLEDIYYGKNRHEKSWQLMNTRNESTSNNDTPNFLKG
ncbi:hypothetical protein E2986_13482 [Frieseomelitta varia]|uniref:Uncharacterized protein n=1 Tax=Frieseomelitta varia TaxID=561572 RepID=A0A833RNP4_9HYME|nr:uncharacterized protein LOC122537352 [Frieseomelitta varia]KAF3420961.1 hypothetical protein E2986_13482 [Frieseomelitta varia]